MTMGNEWGGYGALATYLVIDERSGGHIRSEWTGGSACNEGRVKRSWLSQATVRAPESKSIESSHLISQKATALYCMTETHR